MPQAWRLQELHMVGNKDIFSESRILRRDQGTAQQVWKEIHQLKD